MARDIPDITLPLTDAKIRRGITTMTRQTDTWGRIHG